MASVQEKIARLDKEEEEKEAEEMRLLRLAEKDQRDRERQEMNEGRVARGEKPLPLVPRVSTRRLKIFEDHTIADVNRRNRKKYIDDARKKANEEKENQMEMENEQKMGSFGGRRGKKRSYKKRSYKKRSYKKRSYKKKRSCKKRCKK